MSDRIKWKDIEISEEESKPDIKWKDIEPQKSTITEDIVGGFLNAGSVGATGLEAAGAGLVEVLGRVSKTDEKHWKPIQEAIIENTLKRKEYLEKEGPLAGKEQGISGKVISALAGIPNYLNPITAGSTMAGGSADTGIDLLRHGASLDSAYSGAGIDLALSSAAVAAPAQIIRGPLKNALVTGGLNTVQEGANRTIQNAIRKEAQIQQLPDMDAGDLAAAAIPGAVMGAMVAKPHIKGISDVESSPDLSKSVPSTINEAALIRNRMGNISTQIEKLRDINFKAPESELGSKAPHFIEKLELEWKTLAKTLEHVEKPVKPSPDTPVGYMSIDEDGFPVRDRQPTFSNLTSTFINAINKLEYIRDKYTNIFAKSDTDTQGKFDDFRKSLKEQEGEWENIVEEIRDKLLIDKEFSYKQVQDIEKQVLENLTWNKNNPTKKRKLSYGIDINQLGGRKQELVNNFLADPKADPRIFIESYYANEINSLDKSKNTYVVKGQFAPRVLNIVDKIRDLTGLNTQKIFLINAASEFSPEVSSRFKIAGGFKATVDGSAVIVINPRTFDSAFLNSKFKSELDLHFKNNPNGYEEFKTSYVLAHEIGHFYMHELIRHGLFNKQNADLIIKDFESFSKKSGLNINDILLQPHLNQHIFGEFFADQFVNKAFFNSNPIGKVAFALKQFFNNLLKTFGISSEKLRNTDLMDQVLNSFISKNAKLVEQTGMTLFENIKTNYSKKILPYNEWSKQYSEISKLSVDQNSKPMSETDILSALELKESPEYIIKKMMQMPDIGTVSLKNIPNFLQKPANFFANAFQKGSLGFFGDQQFSRIYFDNPVIQHVYATLTKAEDVATSIKKHLLFGENGKEFNGSGPIRRLIRESSKDSLDYQLTNASDGDLITVWTVLERGFRESLPYDQSLKLYGNALNKSQTDLFNTLVKTFNKQYEYSVRAQNTLGKKHELPQREGWIPAQRRGDFYVTLTVSDIPVHVEAFRTKYEAEAFRKQVQNARPGFINVLDTVDVKKLKEQLGTEYTFAFDLADSIGNQLAQSRYDPTIRAEVSDILERILSRGGKLAGHHNFRQGFTGYLGSQLFKNPVDQAKAIREGITTSIDAYTSGIKRLYINHDTGPLLDIDTGLDKSHPNTMEAARLMRDMATNNIIPWTKGFDDAVRNVFDNIADSFGKYPKINWIDSFNGKSTHAFYIHALTSRPAFWLGQLLSSPLSIRELLRSGNTFEALASFGKGTHNVLTGGDTEFRKAINWIAKNTDTFHPQFINEINKIPVLGDVGNKTLKEFFDYFSGEKFSNAGDSFSRYHTASAFYEHFKAQGFKGKILYRKVSEATNSTMVVYSSPHSPPILKKLGLFGEMVAPIQKFSNAQLGNLVADLRWFAKQPSFRTTAPFIATTLVTAFLGGVIGAPLIAEYELLRKLLIQVDPEFEKTIPSVVEWAFKGDNRVISHGGLSAATGFDIGSSLRWNPIVSGVITADESLWSMFPAVNFTKDISKHIYNLGKEIGTRSVDSGTIRKSGLGLTPGGYKGLVDDLKFDARTRDMVPGGPRGLGIVPQTDKERIATYLGTKTMEFAVDSKISRIELEKEERRKELRRKAYDLLVDSIEKNDDKRMNKAIQRLLYLEINMSDITNIIEEIQSARRTGIIDRQTGITKGNISYEKARKLQNFGEYSEER